MNKKTVKKVDVQKERVFSTRDNISPSQVLSLSNKNQATHAHCDNNFTQRTPSNAYVLTPPSDNERNNVNRMIELNRVVKEPTRPKHTNLIMV